MRRRISSLHPWLYHLSVAAHRGLRSLSDVGRPFAANHQLESLPFRVASHQSMLRRRLGVSDMRLQENKVKNFEIALPKIDGILIRPGETLSLWRLLGHPKADEGYLPGMLLSDGKVTEGIGGGLCQLANLLYWLALHSPLVVTERHRHGYDIFPDSGRTVPFGTGAAIFYNYVDLRFFNPTEATVQFRVWKTDEHLKGELRSDRELPYSYSIHERNHRFTKDGGRVVRQNDLYRRVIDRKTGQTANEEHLMHNACEVLYPVTDDLISG